MNPRAQAQPRGCVEAGRSYSLRGRPHQAASCKPLRRVQAPVGVRTARRLLPPLLPAAAHLGSGAPSEAAPGVRRQGTDGEPRDLNPLSCYGDTTESGPHVDSQGWGHARRITPHPQGLVPGMGWYGSPGDSEAEATALRALRWDSLPSWGGTWPPAPFPAPPLPYACPPG